MRYLKLHPILENSLNRSINDPDIEILNDLKEIFNFIEDDYNISVADYTFIGPTNLNSQCYWDLDGLGKDRVVSSKCPISRWNIVFRGEGSQFLEIIEKIKIHLPLIRKILGLDLDYSRTHFFQQGKGYKRLHEIEIEEITDDYFILTLNFKKR